MNSPYLYELALHTFYHTSLKKTTQG